ncbi:helix-turn-helix transcriptional regulator [Streptomyces sp. NPDC047000]|uniref:helix-turn-helix domain-containing protein n=1 Tax=Streptomyces sp. NPDC047000 TaxID=3155474 RepID=UPI0033C70AC8
MRRPPPPAPPNVTAPAPPPFDATAAHRLRTALGMRPEHVAYGMRASYGLPHVSPDLVLAWERSAASPDKAELSALAAVLWCSPGELTGRPRTLREHRLARGLAPEDVARATGLDLPLYLGMEESEEWRGTQRQSAALADLLELTLPDFVTVTGRDPKLAALLRDAVTARWQAYVRPVGKVVPLERRLLEDALLGLHEDYRARLVAVPGWGVPGDGPAVRGQGPGRGRTPGGDFLDRIVEHFWETVGRAAA